ncbi:rhodanese-like domain-containing protein [Magnetococcus sp. PR-3]|uniref:rhodanese-like domain-containing protein n=1 Tax=Magnetococcus sp. PR-3 TaxID=3120355 RepID=UPI002FCE0F16
MSRLFFLFSFLFFPSGLVYGTSAAVDVPLQLPAVKQIVSTQLMQGVLGGSLLVIDARTRSDYLNGTIPTAYNCPVPFGAPTLQRDEIEAVVGILSGCSALEGLESHTQKKVVVFCNGAHCWRSAKAVLALQLMGFEQVYWYRQGMNQWRAQRRPMM